ncbi:MAG: metalloregulator ArsR/SmtB family transcription factor [Candidatus Aenigmatarchaeota archaeon]
MEIDRKTLKALAADTRLDILKSLGKRRKMPSELAKELNLATSTIVEHLNKLEEANLVKKEETGHKWIYYNLTEKGESLIKPKIPVQFVIVLSITLIIIAGFVYINYANNYVFNQSLAGQKIANECSTDFDCSVGGCSSQICGKKGVIENVVTTCEWKEEYDCLRLTNCKCIEGKCQWEQNQEYKDCLAKIP